MYLDPDSWGPFAIETAAVVMRENAHKHIEAWGHEQPGEDLRREGQFLVIGDAAAEVGPALFYSLAGREVTQHIDAP